MGTLSRDDAKSNPNSTTKFEQCKEEPVKTSEQELKLERRAKRKRQAESQQNWQLLSKLASLSAEVEDIAHEAVRLRYAWTMPRFLTTEVELSEATRQQLANDHQNRLKDILFRQCGSALKLLMTNKWAYPFNAPVDTARFKDYLKFVAQPMDFGTIKTKLDGQKYQHPDEMHADVMLVFANAHKYNPAGSDVYTMASTLRDKFEERWAVAIAPKLGDEKITQANQEMLAKKKILEQQQQQFLEQLEQQRQQLLDRLQALSSQASNIKSQAAAACTPLTQEDKSQLTRRLAHLPQEHFETALSLVLAHHPDLLPQGSSEDSVVNPDHLDALTLRQLQSFIAAVQQASGAADLVEGPQVGLSEGANEGVSNGDRALQPVVWPGLVLGTGRRMARQRRDRASEGLERAATIAQPASNWLPHASSAAVNVCPGEATETSGAVAGGANALGEGNYAQRQPYPVPGSPEAPASSFAGHVQDRLNSSADVLQDVHQGAPVNGGKGAQLHMQGGATGAGDAVAAEAAVADPDKVERDGSDLPQVVQSDAAE